MHDFEQFANVANEELKKNPNNLIGITNETTVMIKKQINGKTLQDENKGNTDKER